MKFLIFPFKVSDPELAECADPCTGRQGGQPSKQLPQVDVPGQGKGRVVGTEYRLSGHYILLKKSNSQSF